jgi:hypothetical protein
MDICSGVRAGRWSARAAVVGAMALALAGCAARVKVTRTRPAELDVAGLENVAVLKIGGNDGRGFANALTRRLLDAGRLSVLDRAAFDGGRGTAAPSGEGAPRGGPPAAALILGDAGSTVSDDVERRETGCPRPEDRKGHLCFELTRSVTVTYDAFVKIVDSRTGAVLAVRSLRCARSDETKAVDAIPGNVDVGALVSSCREELVARVPPLVLPTDVEEEVVLVEDDALPSLAAGNLLAKGGDWPAAHGEYVKAAARADADGALPPERRAKAHYAVGLSLVLCGRFEEGIAALGRSAALADDRDARALLERARAWKADADRLRSQAAGARAPERS